MFWSTRSRIRVFHGFFTVSRTPITSQVVDFALDACLMGDRTLSKEDLAGATRQKQKFGGSREYSAAMGGNKPKPPYSTLITHTIFVDGNRTTVRLEPVIWDALREIARQQGASVHDLVSAINRRGLASSLTSAIRAYVVAYLLAQALPGAPPANLFQ